jgi:hypothetical protein
MGKYFGYWDIIEPVVGCQRLLLHVVKCMQISRTLISCDFEEIGDFDVVRRLMSGGFGALGRLIVAVGFCGGLLGLEFFKSGGLQWWRNWS